MVDQNFWIIKRICLRSNDFNEAIPREVSGSVHAEKAFQTDNEWKFRRIKNFNILIKIRFVILLVKLLFFL